MRNPVGESGLFASLSRLLATALEIAQVRLELLSTELELEKRRIFDGLIWSALAILLLVIGLVLLCGFVILLLWEGHRLAAVGTMALLFLGGGVTLILEARNRLRNTSGMFKSSVTEIVRDRAGLQASGQNEQR